MSKQKKLYQTILADPPWEINQKGNYGAVHHYDLMTLDRIKAMPVADLCEENAHCYLWVTNSVLEHGYDVLRAWGFEPKSIITWLKFNLGLGVYYRNCTEHLLFGVRGRLPIQFKAQPNFLVAPRQDHSHKPEEQFAMIQRCSPGPYLELFARRHHPGWDCWGNEIDSDIDIPGYPVPDSTTTRKTKLKGGAHA